eukprot:CAMPEP_0180505708 /NCGR_PEP_ID=MMETSP1036_2-20121128/47532_1 /TAXON_ID=632150 /ORGANISM="Azadinium spinosum, Strain 3D9" /LENGTH=62 /DNA_ID=CAMNT_0022515465 /DNA_START=235 /DNA_END=420 /DNA_ORIENTATION=-
MEPCEPGERTVVLHLLLSVKDLALQLRHAYRQDALVLPVNEQATRARGATRTEPLCVTTLIE